MLPLSRPPLVAVYGPRPDLGLYLGVEFGPVEGGVPSACRVGSTRKGEVHVGVSGGFVAVKNLEKRGEWAQPRGIPTESAGPIVQ